MPKAANSGTQPKWIIDTHGMRAVLTTSSNSIRSSVISAIEGGTMLVIKSVSSELKNLFPELWDNFKAIKNKKYHSISVNAIRAASALTESYGSSLLGSIPTKEHFQAIAAARLAKCKLVSAGKALTHSKAIASKCNLPVDTAVSLETFATAS